MRSTFDFDKCVERNLKRGTGAGSNNVKWNFRLLDEIAGSGTAVSTIFELKSEGAFRGAKRKIKHTDERRKLLKVEDVCIQLSGLDICNKSPTDGKNISEVQEGLSITQSIAGWNGRSTKRSVISPKARNKKMTGKNDCLVQKGQKVNTSKRSPPSSQELKRRHGVSSGTRRTLFSTPPGKKPLARKSTSTPRTPGGTQSSILMYVSGKKKEETTAGGSIQMMAVMPDE